jgi:hypothetical protein
MEIRQLPTESNSTRSVEIQAGTLSYRALLRCIRRIPGAVVTKASHDPMNDDTIMTIRYKDVILTVETPFSDYFISCGSPGTAFDEFVSSLRRYRDRWRDHFI